MCICHYFIKLDCSDFKNNVKINEFSKNKIKNYKRTNTIVTINL